MTTAINPISQTGITGMASGVTDEGGSGGEVSTLKVIESATYANE